METTQSDVYHHHPFPPPAHHPPGHFDQSSSPQHEYQHSQHQHQQPLQQQLQQQSPGRSKPRTFSFHSDRSRRSSQKSSQRDSYQETSAHHHKESKRLQTKADPSVAISEAEPAVVAAEMTQSALAPLRSITHKDASGNPIADPDKSNPTRNRWERPLDTIRSFEAAIDGGYSRKSMMFRAETDSGATWSRRNSYHPSGQPRFRPNSYYGGSGGNRPQSYRPEYANSQYELGGAGTARNSFYDHHAYNTGLPGQNLPPGQNYSQEPGRQRLPRTVTDPIYKPNGRKQNVYHLSHKDRSYETVTSAAGSGNSEQLGYQTDPTSSDNSSIERNYPAKRAEPVNDYGIGFSQSQTSQNSNLAAGLREMPRQPARSAQQQAQAPAPANNGTPIPRKQVNAAPPKPAPAKQQSAPQEKRKSWFARRFSKNS